MNFWQEGEDQYYLDGIPFASSNFNEYHSRTIKAMQPGEIFTVKTADGTAYGGPDDYLILDTDSHLHICRGMIFRILCEALK